MNVNSGSKISVRFAEPLLDLLAVIDRNGDDYRDFVDEVCTARERIPEHAIETPADISDSILVLLAVIDKSGDDFRDFVDEVCTAREGIQEHEVAILRSIISESLHG